MVNTPSNFLLAGIAGGVLLIVLFGTSLLVRRGPKRLNTKRFQERWLRDVQKLCAGSETWPLAVINADKLLDEALKQRHLKGRTMGERLVAAQRQLSDNDGAWFGHKLRNKIVHEEIPRLHQKDVQNALRGLRQALKDLGALQ